MYNNSCRDKEVQVGASLSFLLSLTLYILKRNCIRASQFLFKYKDFWICTAEIL